MREEQQAFRRGTGTMNGMFTLKNCETGEYGSGIHRP